MSQSKCEYPGCDSPVAQSNFTITTAFFKVRVNVVRMGRALCEKHLLMGMFQKRLPELGRAPGEGIEFKRKAFCEYRKESVSFEECQQCFQKREHKQGFNHVGCQDAFLRPSPLAPLGNKLQEGAE